MAFSDFLDSAGSLLDSGLATYQGFQSADSNAATASTNNKVTKLQAQADLLRQQTLAAQKPFDYKSLILWAGVAVLGMVLIFLVLRRR